MIVDTESFFCIFKFLFRMTYANISIVTNDPEAKQSK